MAWSSPGWYPTRKLAGAEASVQFSIDPLRRVVLDMDSTKVPVYGRQERSAYNGHFESTCYHPLLLFNREGDCQREAELVRCGSV